MEKDVVNAQAPTLPEPGGPAREILATALAAYELGPELGRGGCGTVLAGRHRELGREVAIRQLPELPGADAGLRERFRSDARRLAGLDHPHIVRVYDFVQRRELCALVMQRLTGGTAQDRLGTGGFSRREACAVVVATCSAMQHAHDRGIAHRRVALQNVMFSAEGVVKVTDFGLADALCGGTLPTMALDPAPDVYATGVVLCALVCGEPPSASCDDDLVALLRRVSRAPAGLTDVIARSLSRDPGERYVSARELGAAVVRVARREWGPQWADATGMVLAGAEAGLGRPRRAGRAGRSEVATREGAGAAAVWSEVTARERPQIRRRASTGAAPLAEPTAPLYVAADEQLVDAIEDALARCPADERPLRLRLLCRLAVELHLAGRLERCPELCAQALDVAGEIGGPWAEMLVGYSRLASTWSPEAPAARLAECDELLRVATDTGDREMVHRAHRLRLRVVLELGDMAAADAQLGALDNAAEVAAPWRTWQSALLPAMRALHAGRLDEGEVLAQEALRLGRRADADIAQRCFEDQAVHYTWLLGRRSELVPLAREAARSCPGLPLRRAALAFALAELDRLTEATAQLERVTAPAAGGLPRDANWLMTTVLLSHACGALGDERRAVLLYEELHPYRERFAVYGDCTVTWGPVATALGVLAATAGRVDQAAEHFLDAGDRAVAVGAAAQLALARREHAAALLRRGGPGDRDHAIWLVDDALRTVHRHGLTGLEDRLRRLRAGSRS